MRVHAKYESTSEEVSGIIEDSSAAYKGEKRSIRAVAHARDERRRMSKQSHQYTDSWRTTVAPSGPRGRPRRGCRISCVNVDVTPLFLSLFFPLSFLVLFSLAAARHTCLQYTYVSFVGSRSCLRSSPRSLLIVPPSRRGDRANVVCASSQRTSSQEKANSKTATATISLQTVRLFAHTNQN